MKKIILIAIISLSAFSCVSKKDSPERILEKEITLSGLDSGHWTYFNIEDGSVTGTSTFLSTEEDKVWAARSDWDFAICGDYIKTNGGTSGNGNGGLLKNTSSNYLLIEEAPSDGYHPDELLEVEY